MGQVDVDQYTWHNGEEMTLFQCIRKKNHFMLYNYCAPRKRRNSYLKCKVVEHRITLQIFYRLMRWIGVQELAFHCVSCGGMFLDVVGPTLDMFSTFQAALTGPLYY